jgi:peptide/nickel transport system substrate-binding protein
VPGSLISLRSWKGYWDPTTQLLAGVDFVQVAPGPATVSALISGRVDAGQIDGSDVATMSQNGLQDITAVGNEDLFLLPKVTSAPLDNLQVRTAIQYALDRNAINQVAYAGKGNPTQTLFPKGSPFYSQSVAQAYPYAYDPKKAKDLLAASRVSLSRPLTILLQNKPAIQRAAQVVQADLEAVGFTIKLNVSANALPLLTSKDQQPDFFMAQTTQVSDPDIWIVKHAAYNLGYDNPTFDQANTAAEGAVTTQAQATAYAPVQQILLQDSPWYALVAAPVFVGTAKGVRGISLSSRGAYAGADLKGAYITGK